MIQIAIKRLIKDFYMGFVYVECLNKEQASHST